MGVTGSYLQSPPPKGLVAFGCLAYQLCQKLQKIGLAEAAVTWFKSYLSNRMQKCKANGLVSPPQKVLCGVPQGSILGPLLFLVYINDLESCLKYMKVQLYADDTALYCVYKKLTPYILHCVNSDLANVANWCKKNKLSLNIKKTKYAIYGTRPKRKSHPVLELKIDDQAILQTYQYRYLGMELDVDLNFKGHIGVVYKSLSYKSLLVSRLRNDLTIEATHDIITTMMLPIADYGQLIYGSGNKTKLDRLDSTLDRLLRICYYKDKHRGIDFIRAKAGIDALNICREKAEKVAAFKYAQIAENLDVREIFTRRHDANLVKVVWYKTTKARQSVTYKIAHRWNSLPVGLRTLDSLDVFKNRI